MRRSVFLPLLLLLAGILTAGPAPAATVWLGLISKQIEAGEPAGRWELWAWTKACRTCFGLHPEEKRSSVRGRRPMRDPAAVFPLAVGDRFIPSKMSQTTAPADELPMVPKEFGGKWVAWNRDGTQIIASGETLPDQP